MIGSAGRHIALNMCRGDLQPWSWIDAFAQSWRVTEDHSGKCDSHDSLLVSAFKFHCISTRVDKPLTGIFIFYCLANVAE